jgi:elongation factor 3
MRVTPTLDDQLPTLRFLCASAVALQVAVCMPEIVPKVTEALGNARQGVKDAAAAAMTACMQCVNNKDLEQFIPMLIDTMQNPIKVPDCVHKLAATTFVQVSVQ